MASGVSPTVNRAVNVVVSLGAAVVIFGAMAKILHLSWADWALKIGLTTEALIFIIYAILPPPDMGAPTVVADSGNPALKSIEQHVSHIQIHHPEFLIDNNLVHTIKDWETLREQLQTNTNVKAFTGRAISNGMLSTATQTRGISIMAIDPITEAKTTGLDQNILEGNYLEEGTKNQVLIGRSLAQKLKLQIGSRLVVTFQNTEGDLVSSAFRVGGIFQTANLLLDEKNIYILQSCLALYTGQQTLVNEVALLLYDAEQVNSESEALQANFPNLQVRTWANISPELAYIQDMGSQMLIMIMAIILLALAFGLVNTMLMTVYERVYELGMLMAIGMNRIRVFLMITLETLFLTFVGALAGMALGYITILILGRRGIDLAPVGGDAMLQYGYPSVVYPMIDWSCS